MTTVSLNNVVRKNTLIKKGTELAFYHETILHDNDENPLESGISQLDVECAPNSLVQICQNSYGEFEVHVTLKNGEFTKFHLGIDKDLL